MRKYIKELILISSIIGALFVLVTYYFTKVFKDIYANTDITIMTVVLGTLYLPLLYYLFCDMTRTISRFYGDCKNIYVICSTAIVTIAEIIVMAISIFVIVCNITKKIKNIESFDLIVRTFYDYRYLLISLSALMVLSRFLFAFTIKLDERDKVL